MKRFNPTFESLEEYTCPKWFRDAKFGIWSHWGAQSVPMFGDWYARNMYIQGTPQYYYHLRHYGHPSKFGYKDIVKLWKAEKFDPDALMDLYYKAGARYFVGQAMHTDNFFNFPSKYNRFNSVEMGPKKDICGLWKQAAKKRDMYFGLTEHHGCSFQWYAPNKRSDKYGPYAGVPYDGNDPEYRDFYYDNYEHLDNESDDPVAYPWYTTNEKFFQYWLNVMKELIDMYQPDLLYTDGGLPFGEWRVSNSDDERFKTGLEAVAYYYNTSIDLYGENRFIYTQKDRRKDIYRVGTLDIEKSQLTDIAEEPWQTDTCIGNWFYDVQKAYKKPGHIIEMLVDIISKNGQMLLNVLQLPDGSIDDEARYILKELAAWFAICGDAVHSTRPWRIFGEGDSLVDVDSGFNETAVAWNSSDFRFVTKGNTLYAFMPTAPKNRVTVIKSLTPKEKVISVKLMGGRSLAYSQNFGALTVQLPQELPTPYTNCLAIELNR
ncbi:alpha-L-fucosidase [Vallitalea pronyensis]|uniref:alpha-L-fucosidase n=1 Tax=Vallitalea pronyensis TaxID=1348613 RepID=A0A8J8MJI8_9FIRM|nr:alpha-L-fucosidase [Vallitalea pronyensis]QUI22744.1 alpha-L-fucosidase [Vallitalea pronyensis]